MVESQEIFYDAETDVGGDQTSYDLLIKIQMKKCCEVLSLDRKSCTTRIKTEGNIEEITTKDIDELIINHVETFRVLMFPFASEDKSDFPSIEKIMKDIEELDEKVLNQVINLPNGQRVRLQDMPIPENHPIIITNKQKKSKLYRKMFEYLIKSYHDNEEKIKSYSYE